MSGEVHNGAAIRVRAEILRALTGVPGLGLHGLVRDGALAIERVGGPDHPIGA